MTEAPKGQEEVSGGAALALVLRRLLPAAVWAGAALMVVTVWAFYQSDVPLPSKARVERLIIDEQNRRADTLGDVDVLLAGDSSCLMGIDMAVLRQRLGRTVESLCTIGLVGPAGNAVMLDRYFGRGRRTGVLVLMLHPVTLATGALPGWEKGPAGATSDDRPPPTFGAILRARLADLTGPLSDPALEDWGAIYYGRESAMRQFLVDNHGTLVDPTPFRGPHDPSPLAIAPRMVASLQRFADKVRGYPIGRLLFVLTPTPDGGPTEAALAAVLAALGNSAAPVAAPAVMDSRDFATTTHLNEQGRRVYAVALADALRDTIVYELPKREVRSPLSGR